MVTKRYKKGVSLVLLAFGLAALLGFAALAIDMGNAFNVQNELQKATTTAALAGASAYNEKLSSSENMTNINNAVQDTFDLSKSSEPAMASAQLVGNIQIDTDSGAVRLQTRAQAPTYFIGLIGIKTLEVNARAAALNYPTSFIVMNDLFPLPAADQKKTIAFAEFDDISEPTTHFYNPPPGGKVQVVCTLPLIDMPGSEITVSESGDLDGYMVYVAIDPGGPWYNIASTGQSVGGGPGPLLNNPTDGSPVPLDQVRFFGSGSFDLKNTNIKNARYVAIVDDGQEDGYQLADKMTYVPALTPVVGDGEAGPAMEVDAISIHNHSISISYNDLSQDTDGDGVIDAYNRLIGSYDAPGQTLLDDNQSNSVSTNSTNSAI